MTFLSTFSATQRVVSPILQALSFALLAAIPLSLAVLGALLTFNPIVIALTALPAMMAAVGLPLAFGRPLGNLLSYPASVIIAAPLFVLGIGLQFLWNRVSGTGPSSPGACRQPPAYSEKDRAVNLSKSQPHVGAGSEPTQVKGGGSDNLYPDTKALEADLFNTQLQEATAPPVTATIH